MKEWRTSTINSAKCVVDTSLHTATYVSIKKHPLVIEYVTEIFNLRLPKQKLSNVWHVHILFRYLDRLGDNTLLTNIILIETYCSVITT